MCNRRRRIKQVKSSVRFRFGNNQTLTSERKILLPLKATDGTELWPSIEVVPGMTPFLLSKRALKQLGCRICTVTDTCSLQKLHVNIPFESSASRLYMFDVKHLGSPTDDADMYQPSPATKALHAGATTLSCGKTPLNNFRSGSQTPRVRVAQHPFWRDLP